MNKAIGEEGRERCEFGERTYEGREEYAPVVRACPRPRRRPRVDEEAIVVFDGLEPAVTNIRTGK